jgi:hypothetical protein
VEESKVKLLALPSNIRVKVANALDYCLNLGNVLYSGRLLPYSPKLD